MTECKPYSSLFALVDSHLSKISLQESRSSDAIPIEPPRELPISDTANENVMQSKLLTQEKVLPIPKLGLSESPISGVLAHQVANMLLAKEKRQEDERKKSFKEESENDNDFYIDLTTALQNPGSKRLNSQSETVLSSSSSCESLFKLQYMDYEDDTETYKSPDLLMPCAMDMTYIVHAKLRKGKCSSFGKVLTSKLRQVPSNYFHEKIKSQIKRFSFNIPSPCDLIKEKLRRPTMSGTQIPNIFE